MNVLNVEFYREDEYTKQKKLKIEISWQEILKCCIKNRPRFFVISLSIDLKEKNLWRLSIQQCGFVKATKFLPTWHRILNLYRNCARKKKEECFSPDAYVCVALQKSPTGWNLFYRLPIFLCAGHVVYERWQMYWRGRVFLFFQREECFLSLSISWSLLLRSSLSPSFPLFNLDSGS